MLVTTASSILYLGVTGTGGRRKNDRKTEKAEREDRGGVVTKQAKGEEEVLSAHTWRI